ncbi:hypothetical protein [Pendulispora albinea]|uniref:Uncharacterized protein n=1 Tax=Pendulispora albinea TaxID=2741071 RepID=A0ABZ2LT49_9BACT
MNMLSGLGIWIWQLAACERGRIDAIAEKAKRCGVSWVAIKAGESRSNGQVTRERVEVLRAAGIECAAWWYSVPTTVSAQIALARDLVHEQGVRHLICDAEFEWETSHDAHDKLVSHDWRTEARTFAARLRDAVGPDVYLADAPWSIVKAHPIWPWNEFGAVLDARMDQCYWRLARQPFAQFAARADAAWSALAGGPPRCPIGCMVDYHGTDHAPLHELDEFLDHYALAPAHSLWSWQHLSAAEWAVLEQRAAHSREPVSAGLCAVMKYTLGPESQT